MTMTLGPTNPGRHDWHLWHCCVATPLTLDHGVGESEGDSGEVIGDGGVLGGNVVRVAFAGHIQAVLRHHLATCKTILILLKEKRLFTEIAKI
jgi:hypothetical protein